MKPLGELKATYGSDGIGELVDFTRVAPVQLPADGKYHFERKGSTVHVFGVDRGISKYSIGELQSGMELNGVRTSGQGTEMDLRVGEVEKIILHSEPFEGGPAASRTSSRVYAASGEPGESRSHTRRPGESRVARGESRTTRTSFRGGESRSGGESR